MDWDYQHTVLRGIPEELAKFALGLLSAAHFINVTKTIKTDTLIDHICEESECLKNWSRRGQSSGGKKKGNQADEALAASSGEGGKKRHQKGNCHNCSKPGH